MLVVTLVVLVVTLLPYMLVVTLVCLSYYFSLSDVLILSYLSRSLADRWGTTVSDVG